MTEPEHAPEPLEPAAPAEDRGDVPAGEDKRDDERPGEELDLVARAKAAGDPYFQD